MARIEDRGGSNHSVSILGDSPRVLADLVDDRELAHKISELATDGDAFTLGLLKEGLGKVIAALRTMQPSDAPTNAPENNDVISNNTFLAPGENLPHKTKKALVEFFDNSSLIEQLSTVHMAPLAALVAGYYVEQTASVIDPAIYADQISRFFLGHSDKDISAQYPGSTHGAIQVMRSKILRTVKSKMSPEDRKLILQNLLSYKSEESFAIEKQGFSPKAIDTLSRLFDSTRVNELHPEHIQPLAEMIADGIAKLYLRPSSQSINNIFGRLLADYFRGYSSAELADAYNYVSPGAVAKNISERLARYKESHSRVQLQYLLDQLLDHADIKTKTSVHEESGTWGQEPELTGAPTSVNDKIVQKTQGQALSDTIATELVVDTNNPDLVKTHSPNSLGARAATRPIRHQNQKPRTASPVAETDGQSWQERALCAQVDSEIFFPERGGSYKEAKQVCGACEVRTECLCYALDKGERFGVWGGMSERERERLKNQTV